MTKNTKPPVPPYEDKLWKLWARLEAAYVICRNQPGNRKKKSTTASTATPQKQQERWHLHCLHVGPAMQELADIVTKQVLKQYAHAKYIRFSYESCWVDKIVQASWSGATQSVELADLLVIVKRTVNGVVTRHGMLMQAKCVDDPDKLDKATCQQGGTSSQRERDLLEKATGAIDLRLNGVTKSYNVPGESTNKPGIRDYARYLLIPRNDSKNDGEWMCPYITLWPSNRSCRVGDKAIYPDLIAHMAGVQIPGAGSPLSRPINADTEWKAMVDDVLSWAKGHQSLDRFGGFSTYTRNQFGKWRRVGRLAQRRPHWLRRWWYRQISTLNSLVSRRHWNWLFPMQVLYAVAATPPDHGGTDDRANDEHEGGMVVLQIAISVSDGDELEPYDDTTEFS